jgi:hypothetical protein
MKLIWIWIRTQARCLWWNLKTSFSKPPSLGEILGWWGFSWWPQRISYESQTSSESDSYLQEAFSYAIRVFYLVLCLLLALLSWNHCISHLMILAFDL